MEQERIAVWGAGAIGGVVAAHLLKAGVDLTLVDADEAHVGAIAADGLSIEGPIAEIKMRAPVVTVRDAAGPFDIVLLAVKGNHTAAAAADIAPRLAPGGFVLSLQNGLNAPALEKALGPGRILLALVNFAADVTGPGVIHYGGRGHVTIGEPDGSSSPRLARIVALLRHFDPAIAETGNVQGYLWGKLGYGAILIATALTNETIPVLLDEPAHHPALTAVGREVMQAAAASGVEPVGVDGFDAKAFLAGDSAGMAASFAAMADHYRHSEKQRTGVWRDLAVRRRKTEVAALLEPVVESAAAHGLAMATTRRLIAAITDIEAGRLAFAVANLDRLAA
ncbi:MAG: ketopantoate reductase family protein [Beijerinckiaceae bacterium]